MFNSNAANLALFILINQCIFINVFGFGNFSFAQLNVERVGLLKILNFHLTALKLQPPPQPSPGGRGGKFAAVKKVTNSTSLSLRGREARGRSRLRESLCAVAKVLLCQTSSLTLALSPRERELMFNA